VAFSLLFDLEESAGDKILWVARHAVPLRCHGRRTRSVDTLTEVFGGGGGSLHSDLFHCHLLLVAEATGRGRPRCEAESRVRARSDTRWSPRSRTRL